MSMSIHKPAEPETILQSVKNIESVKQQACDLARSVESVRQQTLALSNARIEALEQKARDLACFVETTRQQTQLQSDEKTNALEQKARSLADFVETLRNQTRLQSETEIVALGQKAWDLALSVETVRQETRLQFETEIATLGQKARDLALSVETVRQETRLQSETEIAALGQQTRGLALAKAAADATGSELEQHVEERTAELAAANHDLAQQNQENEMFVYSVSHDLRSPLVNLEGFSQELGSACHDLRELLGNPVIPADTRARGLALLDNDVAESIRYIKQAVVRLGNIIDALLRLSRAGRVEYQFQAVELNSTVARVQDSMRSTITERCAVVHVDDLPAVWGDRTAIELVFANLIGNALNYLDPQRRGRIEVGVVGDTGSLSSNDTLYVRDNGLGIAPAYHEKIFQAFKRVHPEVAQGEGMGLAIVRRIVERHRGKIWIESSVAKGSTFFVQLPRAPTELPADEPFESRLITDSQELETCTTNH